MCWVFTARWRRTAPDARFANNACRVNVRSKLWLSLCGLHAAASMLVWWLGEQQTAWMVWRADDWSDRPWSLWTSAWVHMNTPHLISNQLAVGALAAIAWLLKPGLRASLAWLLTWPVIPLVLPYWPHIGHYGGLSGLIHSAVAVVGGYLVAGRTTVPMARRWGLMLLGGLLVKLLIERGWHWPVVWSDSMGISVVQAAHLVGAVAGMVAIVVMLNKALERVD